QQTQHRVSTTNPTSRIYNKPNIAYLQQTQHCVSTTNPTSRIYNKPNIAYISKPYIAYLKPTKPRIFI
ncbi:MAG: hypothetical protein ABI207_05950, partial [Crocinitomicaceae bacterium]